MDRPDAWMPHYIGDYMKATVQLTAQQDGIYRRLRDFYWESGGPIPADLRTLHRAARALLHEERDDVEFIANNFFIVEGNYLRHPELDKRYQDAGERYKKKSDAGKKAVAAREQKRWERLNDVSNDEQTTTKTITKIKNEKENQKQPFDVANEEAEPTRMTVKEFRLLHQKNFNGVMNENLDKQAAQICRHIPKEYIEEIFLGAVKNGIEDFTHVLNHFINKIKKTKDNAR
jgi:uncharacterized protein YdaU (DUF1376 family)